MTDDHETFRHQCEVRWLLRKFHAEGAEAVNRYIAMVREKRGEACADRLHEDARAQHRLGSRGENGEWH